METVPSSTANSTVDTETTLLNQCQGYQVNPITKLHLCQVCPYHKYRNQVKPWLKKDREQT